MPSTSESSPSRIKVISAEERIAMDPRGLKRLQRLPGGDFLLPITEVDESDSATPVGVEKPVSEEEAAIIAAKFIEEQRDLRSL